MLLSNFPIKNQLADTNERNKEFDCVPTALASCLQYALGRPYDGAVIKDAVYGKEYTGATAATHYVGYCKAEGASLAVLNGQPAQLIQDILAQLKSGHPLLITEPDPYANPTLGWSHVVAMCGYDEQPGTLTAMDPYGGHMVTLPVSEWQRRLEFNQVWFVEKMAPPVSGVPEGWQNAQEVLTAPNGVAVVLGFRKHILENHWDKDNWPLEKEHGTDQLEGSNPALGKGTQQIFRWKMLGWSQERGVFEEWLGQELLFTRQQVLKYYTLAKQLHDTAIAVQADNVKLATDNAKLQADVQALQQALPSS